MQEASDERGFACKNLRSLSPPSPISLVSKRLFHSSAAVEEKHIKDGEQGRCPSNGLFYEPVSSFDRSSVTFSFVIAP